MRQQGSQALASYQFNVSALTKKGVVMIASVYFMMVELMTMDVPKDEGLRQELINESTKPHLTILGDLLKLEEQGMVENNGAFMDVAIVLGVYGGYKLHPDDMLVVKDCPSVITVGDMAYSRDVWE